MAHVQGPSWLHPWLEDVVVRLPSYGWEPLVVSLDAEGPLQRSLRDLSVTSFSLDAHGRGRIPLAAFRILRRLRDVDVVHAHLIDAEMACAIAGALGHFAVVITRHAPPGVLDLAPIGLAKRSVHRALDAAVVRSAAAVIVSSTMSQREVLRLGASPTRVRKILLGSDMGRLESADRERANALRREIAPGARFVALVVGRLSPEKRVDVVLRAWAEVVQAVADAHLIVAGDGPERSSLEALARVLGIANVTVFAGWRGDIPELMLAADAVAHASATESTGLALVEALGLGRPLVTTPVGIVNEYIEPDVHCIVVPHGDSAALATALLRVFADESSAAAMGQAGREIVKRMSGVEPMVASYAALYEELTGPRRRSAGASYAR